MNGIIYLIEGIKDYETEYKIGFSKNENSLKGRIKNLQTGYSGKIQVIDKFDTKFGRKLETTLHNILSYDKIHGEWFDLNIIDVYNFKNHCEKIEQSFEKLKEFENPFIK